MNPSPSPCNVAVFVSGRGSNLKALLDAQASGQLERVQFIAVFSDVENPPAFDHARRHGIPTIHLNPAHYPKKREFEAAVVDRLREAGTDWIVLAGYMRIVGSVLLEAFPNRIINIHPSLLPQFPGLHAQRQALDNNALESGCTVHFVDAGMDTGPSILQKTVPCHAGDTEETLSERILEQEHKALPEALDLISRGAVEVRDGIVLIRRDASAAR